MTQAGNGLRFPLESLFANGIVRELLWKNLDGYRALEPCVLGPIHFSHPACAQRRDDFIWPEFCAQSQRHTWLRLYAQRNSSVSSALGAVCKSVRCLAFHCRCRATTRTASCFPSKQPSQRRLGARVS